MKQNIETNVKYFEYGELKNGTLEIIGVKNDIPKYVIIPKMIEEKMVTSIGVSAFKDSKITSIIIPNTIKKIKRGAFGNNKLEKVTLNEGLEFIDKHAFQNNNIKEIIIPDSIKEIGDYSFANNKLEMVVLGKSLEKIGLDAFVYNRLEQIIIPNSIRYIEEEAFAYNRIFDKANIKFIGNKNNINIAEDAFYHNVEYFSEYIEAEDYEGIEILECSNDIPEDIVIPSKIDGKIVSVIGTECFYKKGIKSVIIPDGVKEIEPRAFARNLLTEIIIPKSMRKIDREAFSYNNITCMDFLGDDKQIDIAENAFWNNAY